VLDSINKIKQPLQHLNPYTRVKLIEVAPGSYKTVATREGRLLVYFNPAIVLLQVEVAVAGERGGSCEILASKGESPDDNQLRAALLALKWLVDHPVSRPRHLTLPSQ
jgi:hypothetical protein